MSDTTMAKNLSGQRPVMHVRKQEPPKTVGSRADWQVLNVRQHTFATDVQYRPWSSPESRDPPQRNVNGRSETARTPIYPVYKQITFTKAKIRGLDTPQASTHDATSASPKRRRLTRSRSQKTDESSSDMHADVWIIILAHTRPRFVMQMRALSKFFYHLTDVESIWKDARESHFGSNMPPRPSFLTEKQYANLLEWKGCQNPACERRETRKARWVFRVRLCDDCLHQKLGIYKFDVTPRPQMHYASLYDSEESRDQYGTNLIDLIPTSQIWSGKASVPRGVSKTTGKWVTSAVIAAPLAYLKEDYKRIEDEYNQILLGETDAQRMLEWVKDKYLQATQIAKVAADLESWEAVWSRNHKYGPIRNEREGFYLMKANELSPPMRSDVLSSFAAFHTALATPHLPTEQSWATLQRKILPYRSDAEKVAEYMMSRHQPSYAPAATENLIFDRIHEHRTRKQKDLGLWQPEQQFVIDLGRREFEKLIDTVADEDLLLLCLYNVWHAYQQIPNKPRGLIFDGTSGDYRLSLDDARLIVEEIIEPRIKRATLRAVKVLESFKCAGCTRYSSGKRYSFHSAFEHMLYKHAEYVGADLHFHRFLKHWQAPMRNFETRISFPWYLVEWTRSLPLLPTHAVVNSQTKWIPDRDTPYTEMRRSVTTSAFEGRRAAIFEDNAPDDFAANFLHAVTTLLTTRLDTQSIVKIALRYGLDLYRTVTDTEVSLEVFLASLQTAQASDSGLQFKFKCGACNQSLQSNSHTRCVKHPVQVDVLQRHWHERHRHDHMDWATNFAHLPSDIELTERMIEQDEKLQKEQEQLKRQATAQALKNRKKLPNQKAGVLMQKEMATSAFERLFVECVA